MIVFVDYDFLLRASNFGNLCGIYGDFYGRPM